MINVDSLSKNSKFSSTIMPFMYENLANCIKKIEEEKAKKATP